MKRGLSSKTLALRSALQRPKPTAPRPAGRTTVALPEDIAERLRNAAYHHRITVTKMAQQAVMEHLAKLEGEYGGVFPPRPKD
jgi:DNA-binding transcriptional ArsR family regulator